MAAPPRTGRSLSSKPLRVQVRSCKYLHITKRRRRAFKVVGLTWIVERTFAWLARNRRLSKDYELKVQTSETFIDLAAIRLMLKRLAPR
jgi:transposase